MLQTESSGWSPMDVTPVAKNSAWDSRAVARVRRLGLLMAVVVLVVVVIGVVGLDDWSSVVVVVVVLFCVE